MPAPPSRQGLVDWNDGRYEEIASALRPAAEAVVARAHPRPGEHLVDLGCGSGTAALLAAAHGAHVTGVDPAERLLAVAADGARAEGLDAEFLPGDATALPLADDVADGVISSFGLIYAPDAEAAAAEMDRVVRPYARIVFSAWLPTGTMLALARVGREAAQRAFGLEPGPPPFPWHERDALAALLAPYGFGDVTIEEHTVAFTAPSPRAYLDVEGGSSPLWAGARPLLEARGELEAVRAEGLAVLEAGNEDPSAFRATSRFVVAAARRGHHAPA